MIYRNDLGNQQEMDINLDHQDAQKVYKEEKNGVWYLKLSPNAEKSLDLPCAEIFSLRNGKTITMWAVISC